MGRFQTLRGMSTIRRSMERMNSVNKRRGIKGAVSGVICGCSNDCGFAHTVLSVPPPEPKPKEPARSCHHFS